jgi:hypothetical protein
MRDSLVTPTPETLQRRDRLLNEPTPAFVSEILETAPVDVATWSVLPEDEAGPPMVRVVSGWPALGFFVHELPMDRWSPRPLCVPVEAADPGFEPSFWADIFGWSRPMFEVFREIPAGVRRAVRALPAAVQWWALVLLSKVPEALGLAVRSPVLVGLLGWYCQPHAPCNYEDVGRLVRRRRRHLLPLIGLPGELWRLKAIGKVDPQALLCPGPGAVVEALGRPDKRVVRLLQHLPTLSAGTLSVLRDPALLDMASYSLLAERRRGRGGGGIDLALLLSAIREARHEGRCSDRPARFVSRGEVLVTYAAIEPVDILATYDGPFATPTEEVELPGEPVVRMRPLRSADEMLEHGRAVQSCLPNEPDYFRRAHQGVGAMYEVRWSGGPELARDGGGETEAQKEELVATLWLRRHPLFGWDLAEVLIGSDQEVPAWLALRVEDWIDEINDLLDNDVSASPMADARELCPVPIPLTASGAVLALSPWGS